MQDRAIAAIGQIELESRRDLAPWQLYIQYINKPKKTCNMLLACFNITQENGEMQAHYAGVDIEKGSDKNYLQYAYRKGSARGGDITFTTKTSGDFKKKVNVLLKNQLPKTLALSKEQVPEETSLFYALERSLRQHSEQLCSDLLQRYEDFDKEGREVCRFSLRINLGGQIKYLSDLRTIQTQLLTDGVEGVYNKYNKVSRALDKQCSICREQKEEVYGFASPFKYATIDKEGFVSGFFDQRRNWANCPVCAPCALDLELGNMYVTRYLRRTFFGRAFYLVPKALLPTDKPTLKKALRVLDGIEEKVNKTEDYRRREDYMGRLLGADEHNAWSLNMLFFEENMTTKAITIKLMLEEILPSRFQLLFETLPEQINDLPLYHNARYDSKKKTSYHLDWSFRHLVDFWEADFYTIIRKVFVGEPLTMADVWARFMARIRSQYTNKLNDKIYESGRITVLRAHQVLRFLRALGMIDSRTDYTLNYDIPMTEKETTKRKAFNMPRFADFVNDSAGFLDSDGKAGVFALGVLIRLLLNIQQRNLGNTPFDKKFKGYHLSYKDLERIYLEGLDKLNQYQHFYVYADLRDFVASHFVMQRATLSKMDPNELSFYFVAGLELGQRFRLQEEEASTAEIVEG